MGEQGMTGSGDMALQAYPLAGELPNAAPGDAVLYAVCDDETFRTRAILLAFSLNRLVPGTRLHVHVCGASDDLQSLIGLLKIALHDIVLTVTTDGVPEAEGGDDCLAVISAAVPARYIPIEPDRLFATVPGDPGSPGDIAGATLTPDDPGYRALYDALWQDTLIDNIRARFWARGSARDDPAKPRVLVIQPRLDATFKQVGLIDPAMRETFGTGQNAELRRYWAMFAEGLAEALHTRGVNVGYLTIEQWRVNADLVNTLAPDISVLAHKQAFQVEGLAAPAFYYMQMIFRWLFTLDRDGWGPSARTYPHDGYVEVDAAADAFDVHAARLLAANESKFAQPEQESAEALIEKGVIPDAPYIFFPCQIPHDETLLFHADIAEVDLVCELAVWAAERGVHVVFKGHPANMASMEPLMAVAPASDFVRWSNASIHDLIENAAAVYTMNSGTGLEAMLHERPVVTFARADYDVVTIPARIDDLDGCWTAAQGWNAEAGVRRYRQFVDWYTRHYAIDLLDDVRRAGRFEAFADRIVAVLAKKEKDDFIGLEFGCGDAPRRPDFLGVDVRALPTVRYVCNAWEIADHAAPGSIDEIYSRHFFEHLTFEQGAMTLDAWMAVLKPGGLVTLIVPDMEFHIRQWTNAARRTTINSNGLSDEAWAMAGFWGHQRDGATDVWDVHKSGYDFMLLHSRLTQHGFIDVVRVDDKPMHLHVTFRKPHA